MDPGISFADLLAYNADETNHWKQWFAEHASALDLACDVAGAGSVRKLLLHVFAVLRKSRARSTEGRLRQVASRKPG
jgi:hypothetical protein